MPLAQLRLWNLVWMFVVTVTSLRWIATAAAGGPSSLTLWLLAIVCFFIPQGLAVADLSLRFPQDGGLYRWTKLGFGEFHGFVCGWCYWVNNLFYFPSLLVFVSTCLAFALQTLLGNASLIETPTFVITVTLGTLWSMAILSFFGIRFSKWLQDLGGIGTWVPVCLIFLLGLWVSLRYGCANPISASSLIPPLYQWQKLGFFSHLCFALAGLELVTFIGKEIENPRENLVRALLRASFFILFAYVMGTWGILAAVPQEQLSAVNGVILPIAAIGTRLQWNWLAPLIALFLAFAGMGTTLAWFSGAARVPYYVGLDRYLPSWLGKTHPRWKTPHNAIFAQAIISTLFTLFATLGSPRLETIYTILVDMCLLLYFIPYVYLFLVLIKLRNEPGDPEATFSLSPFKRKFFGSVGLVTTSLAILLTLIPSSRETGMFIVIKTLSGTWFMIGIGLVFFFLAKKQITVSPPPIS